MPFKKVEDIKKLRLIANNIRQDLIKMLVKAGSGHSAGPLGMADIFTALYFNILNHRPKQPSWEDRDRLFLSNGHIVPIRYVVMAHAGYFPKRWLNTLRKYGSKLQGHPERVRMPSLETTSGPLGSGLAQASGYAYAARMDNKKFRVYCICSDGEHDAGNHWEAVLFAGHHGLDNLTAIVDYNKIQSLAPVEETLDLEPFGDKWRAFGWNVAAVDGHDHSELRRVLNELPLDGGGKPNCIIANTVKGKGVSFMENTVLWHYRIPQGEEYQAAVRELERNYA